MIPRAPRRRFAALCLLLALAPLPVWAAHPGRPPSLCRVSYPSDAAVAWECVQLGRDDSLERMFGNDWVLVARFNRVDRRHAHAGVSLKVPVRLDDVRDFTPLPAHYPPAAGAAKFILVSLAEQFLGAYENGRLVFSAPAATGEAGHETPAGEFRITAADRRHRSSLYVIEGTTVPYPMTYALRFHVSPRGVAYWIHGRDMPGYPASHGCIGLYDEAMQREHYGVPARPVLDDARRLYEWALGPLAAVDGVRVLADGLPVRVTDGPLGSGNGRAARGYSQSGTRASWSSQARASLSLGAR